MKIDSLTNKYSFTAIIQARMDSSRLPGKVLADLAGKPLLEFLIYRLKLCKNIEEIIIATTLNSSDNLIVDLGKKLNIKVIRGSENNVLDRFEIAARNTKSNILIRITGDCPLIDPFLINEAIDIFRANSYDYLSNGLEETYPDGLDIEIFTKEALLKANKYCTNKEDREHVTPWIKNNKSLNIGSIKNSNNQGDFRWTVDEKEDLEVVRNIVKFFDGKHNFKWTEVIDLYTKKPNLFKANLKLIRNEGAKLSKGQKLWKRAKKVIPGGNMLLSKRPEMFLPNIWPAYYSKAKGCNIWDLEGIKYKDMSIMGIGTNILGYGHPEVDSVVKEVINKGNMSTLNCPEEVLLAEKLVELHPWADMVRFARSGGEANAIAIRIARAASGLDEIAICGYHGWHDWYLATNLENNSRLEEHLLPGLNPNGVPKGLIGTVHPFSYNKLEQLENIIKNNKIGAVKMEVQRSEPPKSGFLEGVRRICDKNNIILIFDECTSGFRENFGGLHKKYKIEPDMAMFGKALGNGYAITAIIGKKEIMESAQSSFISSTFWTERIGPSAAIKTLEVMEKEKSWDTITAKGEKLKDSWDKLGKKHLLPLKIGGLSSLANFRFDSDNHNAYKTLISQEMLKKEFLSANCVYVSIAHNDDVIDSYLNALDEIFSLIKDCEEGRKDIDKLLESEICHNGFKRLN